MAVRRSNVDGLIASRTLEIMYYARIMVDGHVSYLNGPCKLDNIICDIIIQ